MWAEARNRAWPTLLLAALVILGLGSWMMLRHSGASSGEVLRVGDQRGGLHALLSAAGEDKNLPYRIEWATFAAGAPLLEALAADAIDVGPVGDAPFAFAYAGGADIRVVYAWRFSEKGTARSLGLVVGKRSPVRSLRDLVGKRIAVTKGSVGHEYAIGKLQGAGIDPKSILWTFLSNGEAKAALQAGSVDAWATSAPFTSIALIENGDRLLSDGTGYPPTVGFLAASGPAISGKRKLIVDLSERLERARTWGSHHPKEFAAVFARETGLPLNVALYTVDSFVGGHDIAIDPALISAQRAKFDRYYGQGLLPRIPDIRRGYDQSFHIRAAPGS
jgi:sulfonate transport system substrate-binding protein